MESAVLEAVAEVARRLWPEKSVRAEPLAGGITNLNFRLFMGEESVVVRVPGRQTELLGIDRRAEALANSIAAGIGVAPEMLAFDEKTGCIVTLFIEGRPIPAEELRSEPILGEVVTALRRVHGAGRLQALFDPFEVISRYHAEIALRKAHEPFDYDEMAALLDKLRGVFCQRPLVLGHNDLLNSNFIHDGTVRILDWEYAGMADPYFDLANFSVNNELGEELDEAVLRHYFGRTSAAAMARLRLMKLVSEAREAMWGALQLVISELEVDFASYGKERAERFYSLAHGLDLSSLLSAAVR
ncbi:MAG: phosphotransferase [Acidimicrobiales bacterium]